MLRRVKTPSLCYQLSSLEHCWCEDQESQKDQSKLKGLPNVIHDPCLLPECSKGQYWGHWKNWNTSWMTGNGCCISVRCLILINVIMWKNVLILVVCMCMCVYVCEYVDMWGERKKRVRWGERDWESECGKILAFDESELYRLLV